MNFSGFCTIFTTGFKLAASAGAQFINAAADLTAYFTFKGNAVHGFLFGAFHAHMMRADSCGELGRYCAVFMGAGFTPVKGDTKRSATGSALYTFL